MGLTAVRTEIKLAPKSVLAFFLFVIVIIYFLSLAAVLVKYHFDGEYFRLTQFFDVGIEDNIPTIYSVVALVFAGVVCFVTWSTSKTLGAKDAIYWFFLGVVMVFLGFDEGATIHETIGSWVKRNYHGEGYFQWLWVVPYGVLTAWFAAAYFPFLMRLPNKTRLGLILSGAIFVGGAIGVEMISAAEYEAAKEAGVRSLKYYLLYSLEEFMEMLGIALFIYYVLDYLASLTPSIELKLRSEQ